MKITYKLENVTIPAGAGNSTNPTVVELEIPVCGLPLNLTANMVDSVKINALIPEVDDLDLWLFNPDHNTDVNLFIKGSGTSGVGLYNTEFNNTSTASPLGTGPYTGEFASGYYQPDNGFNEFTGNANGVWTFYVANFGLTPITFHSLELTFNTTP